MSTTSQTQKKADDESKQAKKQRVVSDASRAAFIFNKLTQIDAQEKEEIEASPETIRNKYQARRDTLLADESQTVLELVRRLRG